MRPILPSIRRSLPLRMLAAIAWWMLALPVFVANVPMPATAGAMLAAHINHPPLHRSASPRSTMSMQTGGGPDHHHNACHPSCSCHCPTSCAGLLLSTDYDAALAFVVYADEDMLAVADAPSPIASPPFRPPAT